MLAWVAYGPADRRSGDGSFRPTEPRRLRPPLTRSLPARTRAGRRRRHLAEISLATPLARGVRKSAHGDPAGWPVNVLSAGGRDEPGGAHWVATPPRFESPF